MAAGALAGIFVNPGENIHESICTTIWGTPDLDSAGPPADDPGPRGQPARRRRADRAGASRGRGSRSRPRVDTGWRHDPGPRGRDPGQHACRRSSSCCTATSIPGTSASATTPPATRRCWSWRASSGRHRDRLARSLRIAWWSGHSHGRYAGSTWYADAFGIDLARGLRGPGQLRLARLPLGRHLQRADGDERGRAVRRRRHPRDDRHHAADRSGRRAPATTPSTASGSAPSTCSARRCRQRRGRRRATTRSAAAAPTSPGTPRTTRWRSPTGTTCCATCGSTPPRVLRVLNAPVAALRLAADDGRVPRHPRSLPGRGGRRVRLRPGPRGRRRPSTPRWTASTPRAPADADADSRGGAALQPGPAPPRPPAGPGQLQPRDAASITTRRWRCRRCPIWRRLWRWPTRKDDVAERGILTAHLMRGQNRLVWTLEQAKELVERRLSYGSRRDERGGRRAMRICYVGPTERQAALQEFVSPGVTVEARRHERAGRPASSRCGRNTSRCRR